MTTDAALLLPKRTPHDHAIELKEGATPPWGPIYALNEPELEEIRKLLKRMTDMGVVRPSKSSCSSPVFIPKGHGHGLRLCRLPGHQQSDSLQSLPAPKYGRSPGASSRGMATSHYKGRSKRRLPSRKERSTGSPPHLVCSSSFDYG